MNFCKEVCFKKKNYQIEVDIQFLKKKKNERNQPNSLWFDESFCAFLNNQ